MVVDFNSSRTFTCQIGYRIIVFAYLSFKAYANIEVGKEFDLTGSPQKELPKSSQSSKKSKNEELPGVSGEGNNDQPEEDKPFDIFE